MKTLSEEYLFVAELMEISKKHAQSIRRSVDFVKLTEDERQYFTFNLENLALEISMATNFLRIARIHQEREKA